MRRGPRATSVAHSGHLGARNSVVYPACQARHGVKLSPSTVSSEWLTHPAAVRRGFGLQTHTARTLLAQSLESDRGAPPCYQAFD